MTEEIYNIAILLRKAIEDDDRVISLNEIEKKMNENEEVMALAYQKDMAVEKYNDLLKYYRDDSEEVNKARQELALRKKELEEHPLVREYLNKYQQVRLLYERINNTLFSYLNNDMCPKK